MSNLIPKQIRRLETNGLEIAWNNGTQVTLSSKILREQCPCATCRDKRGDTSHAAPITNKKASLRIIESSFEDELALEKVWAVGNYAIGMRWKDGHDTGIYTYEYLSQLANDQKQ